MAYKKIPLEEQLEKAGRERIHPEYDACAIRAFGRMPLSDYMKNDNCRTRLGMMLGIPPERLEKMTVPLTTKIIHQRRFLTIPLLLCILEMLLNLAYLCFDAKWRGGGGAV